MGTDIITSPSGILIGEHLLIGRMVNLMREELEKIEQGKKADPIFY